MNDKRILKHRLSALCLALTLLSFSFLSFADLQLPSPQTEGGLGLFDSLKKRSSTSAGAFPAGQLSEQELSTLLWSASGLNRGSQGWTVPMAQGLAPYVRIYVAGKAGVWRYEWAGHYLRAVSENDIRADIGLQAFTRRAAYALIFVADSQALTAFKDKAQANDFSQMATGAMSQNIYLAAAALKLSARYIHSIKPEIISSELKLSAADQPIGMLIVGK